MSAGDRPGSKISTRAFVWGCYWVGIFILMHWPLAGTGGLPFSFADKVVHFTLYFGLTWLGAWRLRNVPHRLTAVSLCSWACIYVIYGGIDEWLQPFVGRTMSLGDWLADLAGVVTASVVIMLGTRRL